MRDEYFVDREAITRAPTHPGVFFAEDILPALGRRTIVDIAAMLGVSRRTLHRVMSGATALSPDLAVRLGKLCGNGPELWLNMQARYDAWEARRRLGKSSRKFPPWPDYYPALRIAPTQSCYPGATAASRVLCS
jgi:antitoxin HigA-1